MLKSYFVIALRNLVKFPALSSIKVLGLSIGVCGCIIVCLLARLEFSFDKFRSGGENVYRVYTRFAGVYEGINRAVPLAFPEYLREKAAGVDAVSQLIVNDYDVIVPLASGNRKTFAKPNLTALADSNYFKVFPDYQWLIGSPASLNEPYSVVLTESKAKLYFGTSDMSDLIGKTLIYQDSLEVTVKGIVADLPGKTDFYFTDFLSLNTTQRGWMKPQFDFNDWGSISSSWMCLFRISKGKDITGVSRLLKEISKERDDITRKDIPSLSTFTSFEAQPLSDIHFNTDIGTTDFGRTSVSMGTIEALIGISLLMLIVAVINFVNLETAQALTRSREVGIRKVMGGTHRGLMASFLTESFVVTGIAVMLAIPMAKLALIFFSEFLPSELSINLGDLSILMFIISLTILVAFLAGIYPALVLSSYRPVVALRMKNATGRSGSAFLRKVLTVFQFTFSQSLIAGALIIGFQISWMLDKDLGITHDTVLNIQMPWWEKPAKRLVLRTKLERLSEVAMISQNTRPAISQGNDSRTLTYKKGDKDIPLTVNVGRGDTSYLNLFGLTLLAGRNVMPVDSLMEIVVNKTYCDKLGMSPISLVGEDIDVGRGKAYHVVGVVSDFHLQSLHETIKPWMFQCGSDGNTISLRLSKNSNLATVLESIKKEGTAVYGEQELEIQFLDDTIRKFYESEQRISKLANTATGLAIFISCLGLFGLASFTALQRTKEIGIRKVLGASVNSIVALLTWEFLLLVLISLALAIPMAWYGGTKWLDTFPYRMDLGIWIFLASGTISLFVAFITVGLRAAKAAMVNPVDSLKCE